jgi:hypothetical protein
VLDPVCVNVHGWRLWRVDDGRRAALHIQRHTFGEKAVVLTLHVSALLGNSVGERRRMRSSLRSSSTAFSRGLMVRGVGTSVRVSVGHASRGVAATSMTSGAEVSSDMGAIGGRGSFGVVVPGRKGDADGGRPLGSCPLDPGSPCRLVEPQAPGIDDPRGRPPTATSSTGAGVQASQTCPCIGMGVRWSGPHVGQPRTGGCSPRCAAPASPRAACPRPRRGRGPRRRV